MNIKIINTVPTFLDYWQAAEDKTKEDKAALWQRNYRDKWSDVFSVYFTNWGGMELLDSAIDRYTKTIDNIRENAKDIENRVEKILLKMQDMIGFDDLEVHLVIMVGFYCSNGWVTRFDGKKTIFIAAEFYENQDFFDLLIAHELMHLIYHEHGNIDLSDATLATAMFDEGLATYGTNLLIKGLEDHEYLWTSDQYYSYWKACDDSIGLVADKAKDLLSSSDRDHYRNFFSMRPTDESLPIRAGYHLGYHCLKQLAQTHSLEEMFSWDNEEIKDHLASTLQKF